MKQSATATHRVLVNIAGSEWVVRFIAPDGKMGIGPSSPNGYQSTAEMTAENGR